MNDDNDDAGGRGGERMSEECELLPFVAGA